MYQKVGIVLVFLLLFTNCESLRILVAFPMASVSHSILGHGVARHLLEAGHEIVHITSFPRNESNPKLKEINVGNIFKEIQIKQAKQFEGFKLKNLVGKGNFGDSIFFYYFALDYHRQVFEFDEVENILSNPKEKFDAVVVEWFFHDALAGFGPVFQCPLIWIGSTEAHWQVLKLVDEIPNPSYNVDILSTYSPPMTFIERTLELWAFMKKYIIMSVLITPAERSLYDKVFTKMAEKRGIAKIPSYDEAIYNGSFLLINSHPSYGTPFRLPQNAKYIGGYHVDSNVKPLPKDLQKIMDEAVHGVIYFSMGSNLKSSDMTNEMKNSLLKMFSKLKQTIIWKFETDLENVPQNIHLVKWAPQQSIFSHPNLRIFITHGGQLSTTEAIHFGVPVIGIPVLGDQYVNMKSVESKGFGITVQLGENLDEGLIVAVQEMLDNPKYKIKAKEISMRYHDRPMAPGKEMVFWVEHVVKTQGAGHLRSPALLVAWYQKMYLDLLALLLFFAICIKVVVKKILCKCCHKKEVHKKKKQ